MTPEQHRKRIARRTLHMSPAAARVAGGPTFAEAYRAVFGIDLGERIRDLQREYPAPCDLCFELSRYGYTWADLPALAAEAAR